MAKVHATATSHCHLRYYSKRLARSNELHKESYKCLICFSDLCRCLKQTLLSPLTTASLSTSELLCGDPVSQDSSRYSSSFCCSGFSSEMAHVSDVLGCRDFPLGLPFCREDETRQLSVMLNVSQSAMSFSSKSSAK